MLSRRTRSRPRPQVVVAGGAERVGSHQQRQFAQANVGGRDLWQRTPKSLLGLIHLRAGRVLAARLLKQLTGQSSGHALQVIAAVVQEVAGEKPTSLLSRLSQRRACRTSAEPKAERPL